MIVMDLGISEPSGQGLRHGPARWHVEDGRYLRRPAWGFDLQIGIGPAEIKQVLRVVAEFDPDSGAALVLADVAVS